MPLISLYTPGILSIEGVQSLGFALDLEASPPVGRDSIVSVDGHRFVKSVRRYRRLLRRTVDTKRHFINSAVYRFEKQNKSHYIDQLSLVTSHQVLCQWCKVNYQQKDGCSNKDLKLQTDQEKVVKTAQAKI